MARVQGLDPRLRDFARALRGQATDAERILWSLLRNRRLGGLKFRRQHPIGPYILDFYCVRARLAVEVDGGQHWTEPQQQRDAVRAKLLCARGVEVLRFSNREVLHETEAVLEVIWMRLMARAGPSL
ncbi:MAG: endonuclease domain-containing protein [Sandaracinaceae bacterium]|nr:endonuclease domain-containing protein [Sandaracinaceae bacterium]